MRLTIKSGGCENHCQLNLLTQSTTDKAIRKFGLMLMRGINTLKSTGYYTNFYLDQGPKRYTTPIFKETRFFAKARKAVLNKKVCSCKATILCSCHEKCEKCQPCEAGTKTAGVVDRIAIQVIGGMARFNEQYNDPGEGQTMEDHGQ